MRFLYDAVYLIAALLYVPVLILRRKLHRGFLMRLGFLGRLKGAQDYARGPVWVHAVSVGEAMVARGFLEAFRPLAGDRRFVISTVTETGNAIARSMAKPDDTVIYFPLDLSFVVEKAVSRIKPCLFVCVETEVWPNFISTLSRKGVPCVIINARISDASLKGYRFLNFILRRTFSRIGLACCQTVADARRLISLGVEKERVRVTGNMKFDLKVPDAKDASVALPIKEGELLWVCGSTHPGEEEILIGVYRSIQKRFPHLKLLIAPRHPDRAGVVCQLLARNGFIPLPVSSLAAAPGEGRQQEVFVLDTVGELFFYYARADVVFVGGSLVRHGGHNILEPALLAKPILFGPHMFNFRQVAAIFLQNKAACAVGNAAELRDKMAALLLDAALRDELGRRAKQVLSDNQGATRQTVSAVMELYKSR